MDASIYASQTWDMGGGGRTSCSPYITCKRLILKDVNKAMDI
jgi:hypothetical protein